MEFILNSNNYIFTSALVLMLFIALLEGLMSLFGAGMSTMLESIIPDMDIDTDISGDSDLALSRFFTWIKIKKVPILMLIVIFLTSFGIVGLIFQSFIFDIFGIFLNQWLVTIPTLAISIYMLNLLGGLIAKVLPKDETSSISNDDLIGYIATITLGKAKKGYPAEAKTQDNFGQTHYFMIEPDSDDITFIQGQKVLILGKIKSYYFATDKIPNKLKEKEEI